MLRHIRNSEEIVHMCETLIRKVNEAEDSGQLQAAPDSQQIWMEECRDLASSVLSEII